MREREIDRQPRRLLSDLSELCKFELISHSAQSHWFSKRLAFIDRSIVWRRSSQLDAPFNCARQRINANSIETRPKRKRMRMRKRKDLPVGAVGCKWTSIESDPYKFLIVQLYWPKSLKSAPFRRKMLRMNNKSGDSCSIIVVTLVARWPLGVKGGDDESCDGCAAEEA